MTIDFKKLNDECEHCHECGRYVEKSELDTADDDSEKLICTTCQERHHLGSP